MGKNSIFREFFRYVGLNVLGMIGLSCYILADTYFVSKALGTSGLAALNLAISVYSVINATGLMMGAGGGTRFSIFMFQGHENEARRVYTRTVGLALAAGGVFLLAGLFCAPAIAALLGADADTMDKTTAYLRVILCFAPCFIMNNTLLAFVRNDGNPRLSMTAMITGSLANIVLDYLFMFPFSMGMSGAAIATAISQVVSTLVYLFYVLRKKSVFSFHIRKCCFSRKIMSEILKIGIPTLVFQLLTSLSITLINLQTKGYGDSVIAGMGVVTRIISMGSLMVFGFMKGFQPIAGYSYGSQKYDRLHEAIRTSILWSTIFCAIFGLVMALFPTQIMSQFTKGDLDFIQAGQKALRANGLSFLLFGFYTVYSSLFLALGKAKEGFVLGACRQGICFVPIILLLPALWGINGILYAQPIADVISAIVTVFMAVHLHRELLVMGKGVRMSEVMLSSDIR